MAYDIYQARREVFAAIERVVGKDMEAEIEAGDRLIREGKGTTAGGPYDTGLTPEQLPIAVQATREVLGEIRRRAQPAPAEAPPSPGSDARGLPDGTLVTCEHCPTPHPKGDDGRPCRFPKVASAGDLGAHRIAWQCSGCRWGFIGRWRKTCPACGREDYWTGSVSPDAKLWEPPATPIAGAVPHYAADGTIKHYCTADACPDIGPGSMRAVPARIPGRCSVCGAQRQRRPDGSWGACSLVPSGAPGDRGCPDPLRDFYEEHPEERPAPSAAVVPITTERA